MSWIQQVYQVLEQEAQQQGIQFPTPELRKLMTHVEYDIMGIYQDLLYDGIIPTTETIREVLRYPTVVTIIDASYTVVTSVTEIQAKLQRSIQQGMIVWQEYIKYTTEGKRN